MKELSTQPYKGARDYYPNDMRQFNHVAHILNKVVSSHGYEQYQTPILEPIEVYKAKTGDALVSNETYLFTDRGGREVSIRPEATPSISRMIAKRRQEMPYPARMWSLMNFMRYERPQKGREREFWQLNVDVFGVESNLADVELLTISDDILKTLGADESMYQICVNSRLVLISLMKDYLELNDSGSSDMIKLLDKKKKLSESDFRQLASEILGNSEEKMERLFEILDVKKIEDLPQMIKTNEAYDNLVEIISLAKKYGISSIKYDPTLARGLDYYTDFIFEVFDLDPENNRSIFGGGRYDGLVGLFGVDPIPTTGFGLGLTTLFNFIEAHNLKTELFPSCEVEIIPIGEIATKECFLVAKQLRSEGVNTEIDFSDRKLDKKIQSISKKGIKFCVFVGDEELEEEIYTLKNLEDFSEEKLGIARIVSIIKDSRQKADDKDAEFEFGIAKEEQ
mgnify:FL=1